VARRAPRSRRRVPDRLPLSAVARPLRGRTVRPPAPATPARLGEQRALPQRTQLQELLDPPSRPICARRGRIDRLRMLATLGRSFQAHTTRGHVRLRYHAQARRRDPLAARRDPITAWPPYDPQSDRHRSDADAAVEDGPHDDDRGELSAFVPCPSASQTGVRC
jgi:hypothetical protein